MTFQLIPPLVRAGTPSMLIFVKAACGVKRKAHVAEFSYAHVLGVNDSDETVLATAGEQLRAKTMHVTPQNRRNTNQSMDRPSHARRHGRKTACCTCLLA